MVSELDSGAEGKFCSNCSRDAVRIRPDRTVLGKLFTPIEPLFTKLQNR